MKYFEIVFISAILLAALGCSLLESAIEEIPFPTRPATTSPASETVVSPAATPQSQTDPDASPPRNQQPTAVPNSNAPAAQQPTETPDSTAPPTQQSTTVPDTTVSPLDQPTVIPAPTGSDTPSPTVAPADPSTPDTTVVETTPIPVVEPEPEAPAMPRQLTTSPGDELDPAWDPRGGTIAYMTTKPGATPVLMTSPP